ncbi:MAG: zf-HC2 domain-containing protein [Terracidiphilus sp.]|jgi:hypothetical protein
MDHSEAIRQKAAEGYLLNELTPEVRAAFEEHYFGCTECALDLRAGSAFIEEAKVQLPKLASPLPVQSKPRVKRSWRLSWLQPAFAAPAFASLLLVLGYQNLVTLPRLQAAANQPRLLSQIPLHGAMRGAPLSITASRKQGIALPIDLPVQVSDGTYASYSLNLIDPHGQLVWTGSVAASRASEDDGQQISLVLPGAMLQDGSYSMTVSGVTASGERSGIDQYIFNLHVID